MKASFTIDVNPAEQTVALCHLNGERITTLPYSPTEMQIRMMWRAMLTYAEKAPVEETEETPSAKPNGKGKKPNIGDLRDRVSTTANRGMDVAEKLLDGLESIFGTPKK